MNRIIGFAVGAALILVGVGQAVARDWIIDGWFILTAGVGLVICILAYLTYPPEAHA